MQVRVQAHVFHIFRGLNLRLKAARVYIYTCTHKIYILRIMLGMSFRVFQSQGYLVAERTESRQSTGYLGAKRTESRQSTRYPWRGLDWYYEFLVFTFLHCTPQYSVYILKF